MKIIHTTDLNFHPISYPGKSAFRGNFGFWILKFRIKEFCLIKLMECSDSTNPKSLRGAELYGPSGFRLVEPIARRKADLKSKIKNP